MKVLWKDGDYELVILDKNNYAYGKAVVTEKDGKTSKHIQKPAHFISIEHAVKHVCRMRANDRCEDLNSWLTEYKASQAYFEKIFEAK